jgi:hypothetical protein
MRIIGLDLAITAAHRAVVADEQGQFITPVLRVHSRARELDRGDGTAKRRLHSVQFCGQRIVYI